MDVHKKVVAQYIVVVESEYMQVLFVGKGQKLYNKDRFFSGLK